MPRHNQQNGSGVTRFPDRERRRFRVARTYEVKGKRFRLPHNTFSSPFSELKPVPTLRLVDEGSYNSSSNIREDWTDFIKRY